ncbi:TPM domain-containing protein [uncultured Prevotella sp.]|uniref:TPM domain-containing protein n=1 Tax=uncultured Prevotella sp. TaxID=159272 RepID=UPI00266C9604|nr:TPM domain-containing protein [uncultured Prevotella sp.]
MIRRLQTILIACLIAVTAWATGDSVKEYKSVDDVPNVRLTDVRRYVSDPTSILSPAATDTINAILGRLEKSTGIETAVVMLPSIGENDIFDFSTSLFRKWGIGKKKSNNGLLILFVMDQHKVRFATGYGIEGTMTDAMSKRIQMQYMVPAFKRSDWNKGMVDGVRATAKVLDGSMEPEAADSDTDTSDLLFSIGIIVGVILLAMFVSSIKQRCPKCRKRSAMKQMGVEVLRVSTGKGKRKRIRRTTYVCQYCGHIMTKDEDIDDNSGSAAASGFILGSMLGSGGRGGDGSFGGSFGGGSTGGGGSTSDW